MKSRVHYCIFCWPDSEQIFIVTIIIIISIIITLMQRGHKPWFGWLSLSHIWEHFQKTFFVLEFEPAQTQKNVQNNIRNVFVLRCGSGIKVKQMGCQRYWIKIWIKHKHPTSNILDALFQLFDKFKLKFFMKIIYKDWNFSFPLKKKEEDFSFSLMISILFLINFLW